MEAPLMRQAKVITQAEAMFLQQEEQEALVVPGERWGQMEQIPALVEQG